MVVVLGGGENDFSIFFKNVTMNVNLFMDFMNFFGWGCFLKNQVFMYL